jgi:HPt (histidine-containing phosphotransfer) domain-containing protein
MSVTDVVAIPLDLEDGLARAGGELEFYRELLDLLLEDVPPRIGELRSAIGAGDPERVARTAHAIKGAAANLSAHPLRDAAYKLEMKGREGRAAGLEPFVAELEAEFARLSEHVRGL